MYTIARPRHPASAAVLPWPGLVKAGAMRRIGATACKC